MSEGPVPAEASIEAMTLAVDAAARAGKQVQHFRIVLVENQLSGRNASAVMWRVRFKLAEAIPTAREGKIGKGGEFEVEVDTESGTGRLL